MTRCAGCDVGIAWGKVHTILRKNYCGRCAEEIEAAWHASREGGTFEVRTAGPMRWRVWLLIWIVAVNLIALLRLWASSP